MTIKLLTSRFKAFCQDTSGNITVEFVLAMPILFWTFMASYVFFDGYRQSANNLKAAYTISDLISRETLEINDDYIDSMYNLLTLMTGTNENMQMRISVVRWDQDDDQYYLHWTANRGYSNEMSDASLAEIKEKLPTMSDNDYVILVETNSVFEPVFRVKMDNINLENFVFSRPRFAGKVDWEGAT